MGKKTPGNRTPDYSGVIQVIEHWLQHGSSAHPYGGHEEAARAMESGDAWRAMMEIGAALDKVKIFSQGA